MLLSTLYWWSISRAIHFLPKTKNRFYFLSESPTEKEKTWAINLHEHDLNFWNTFKFKRLCMKSASMEFPTIKSTVSTDDWKEHFEFFFVVLGRGGAEPSPALTLKRRPLWSSRQGEGYGPWLWMGLGVVHVLPLKKGAIHWTGRQTTSTYVFWVTDGEEREAAQLLYLAMWPWTIM